MEWGLRGPPLKLDKIKKKNRNRKGQNRRSRKKKLKYKYIDKNWSAILAGISCSRPSLSLFKVQNECAEDSRFESATIKKNKCCFFFFFLINYLS